MDVIDKEKLIIGKLIDLYKDKDFEKDLQIHADAISQKFNAILKADGEEYKLITNHNGKIINHFNLIKRIKEPDSLNEKFYRMNMLNSNFREFKEKIPNDGATKQKILNAFKLCDDVIGIKILTDLNEDCKKVLTIIRNNEEYLKREKIKLNKRDLAKQPVPMLNGLEIFKIKGTFNDTYAFELQIKSKIVSVWGEMEHSIFYKDYFISPIRETTQVTMNHIGKLLFQIDNLLFSVRQANIDYLSKEKFIQFLSWFDVNYTKKISSKLGGIGYKIDLFAPALFDIKVNEKINDNIAKREFLTKHFEYKAKNDLIKNYIIIRNDSYELKIFESIVFSWIWIPSKVDEKSIDKKIDYLLTLLINFLANQILTKNNGDDLDITINYVKNCFEKLIKYKPKAYFFLSGELYWKHYELKAYVKSEMELIGNYEIEIFNCIERVLLLKRSFANVDGFLNDNKSYILSNKEILIKTFNLCKDNIKLKEVTNMEVDRQYLDEVKIKIENLK